MNRNKIILFAMFLLWITGCASIVKVPILPADYEMKAVQNSVVIGRLSMYSSDGEVMKTKGIFGIHVPRLVTIENITTGKKYQFDGNQDEIAPNFFISIPTGVYSVIELNTGYRYSLSGRFEVGREQVVYIGTLRFNESGPGVASTLGFLAGKSVSTGKWIVEDDFSTTVKSFQERYPEIKNEVVKSLIKY